MLDKNKQRSGKLQPYPKKCFPVFR